MSGVSSQLIDAEFWRNYYETEYNSAIADLNAANQQIYSLQSQLNNSLTQADVDAAYAEGAASVTPEDGIGQADVDAAYAEGTASVTPEDGIGQADVDAAYAEGAASVTPEDGIGQADVDAVQSELDAVNEALGAVQSELDAVNEALGAAMANQEDGIGQANVDAAAEQAYIEGIVSVEIEVETQNIPLDLPQGWSIFGYTCLESLDVVEAFSGISDSIEIVKDEWGLAYLPAWGFSAFDNLEFGEGYQIKMLEEVADFLFCETVIGYNTSMIIGCTDAAAFNYNSEANTDDGSCVAVVNGCTDDAYSEYLAEANTDDGSCETLIIEGCLNCLATNYNADANTDDGSCEFEPGGLIGSWDIHSMYDLNLITGEWESLDLEDVGGADIAFDADSISLPDYDFSTSYNVICNSNELQISLEEEGLEDEPEIVSWIYSFGNEHIFTGEDGHYLFLEETYYNNDGTISDHRYMIYLQP